MTSWHKRWFDIVARKKTILCVGLDPAHYGQRQQNTLGEGLRKVDFCLEMIEKLAPYCAAMKLNLQYFRDLSGAERRTLTDAIHAHDMLAVDDAKVCDIGSTNDAAFFQIASEGFDAATYSPFPGNVVEAYTAAGALGLGLITLVWMSNPEFTMLATASIEGDSGSKHFARLVGGCQTPGIVIGAPSQNNSITREAVQSILELCPEALVLVPGLGAQGGDADGLIGLLGQRIIANVGRNILYAPDPIHAARLWRDRLWATASKVAPGN